MTSCPTSLSSSTQPAVVLEQEALSLPELREKCGVFGIISPHTLPLGQFMFYGLYALQHRGQEACGMAVFDDHQLFLHKDLGLVNQVFSQKLLDKMTGQVGIGHVRYATTGQVTLENAQPVVARTRYGGLVLGHNGNLINLHKLQQRFNVHLDPTKDLSDSHVMARALAKALDKYSAEPASVLKAAVEVFSVCEGAFSVVFAIGDCLVAVRDRNGIRPLVVGRLTTGEIVFASETSALDIVGASLEKELAPGELVVVTRTEDGTLEQTYAMLEGEKANHFCVFEMVYFARPDSVLQNQTVYNYRVKMGQRLAEIAPAEADLVIPVPDSGFPAAIGFSRTSGIPFIEGLIKNRYVGRTFINPTQALRENGLRLKLNPLTHVLKDKRCVIVDDSIVRGTTSRRLVKLLRDAGVKEIHLRISSAPVKHPCFYGIDMSTEEELIANHKTLEELREWLGVESLAYLEVQDMLDCFDTPVDACTACFSNRYPAGKPEFLQQSLIHTP
ncbi:MAG: amidophosphoribosyltransferase [Vampirovibrionales bacterium]